MESNNITKRILIPLSLTLLFLLTISIVSIYWLQRVHLNKEVEKRLEETEQLFQMKLDEEAKVLESQITLLQLDKNLQNAFQAREREMLLHHARPFFDAIRTKYQITHFYFINTDKICFLRVHNPPLYGETIPRFTLADAIRKEVPVYGIELGKYSTFTLRLVYPWKINGELVGYIELGKEIEHITVALKKILGVELLFVINKSFINRTDWEEGLKMMGHSGDWTQFSQVVIVDRTMPAIPPVFHKSLEMLLSHPKKEHFTTILKESIGDQQYRGGLVPIFDAGNRFVGNIIILIDVSKQEAGLKISLVILITLSVVIGGGLFGFFYSFINRIESELVKCHDDIRASEKIKNELLKEKIQQHDFMQQAINSLDHPFFVINANTYQIELANSSTRALGIWPTTTCYGLTQKRGEPCINANGSCPLREVKKTKKPIVVERIHFDKVGNPRNIEVHGFPIIDSAGNVTQLIKYYLDITERKHAETLLHQKNKELQAQNEKLETFAHLLEKLQQEKLYQLNKAYERFVPREFFSLLDKQSIIEVQLGQHIEKEMTILFSDIREFTRLSEKMTPQNNFDFINAFLSRMEPIITQHHGFVDKYIGDAIMALFPSANDAVNAAIGMLKKLAQYNQSRGRPGRPLLQIGIGLNTGPLMLGTVGGQNRMDGTVISDAVNLGARVEQLTKIYGTPLLITECTYKRLTPPSQYLMRVIDTAKVKGKSKKVTVYEVFDADKPDDIVLKNNTLYRFKEGVVLFHESKFKEALACFEIVLRENPSDKAARVYLDRCHKILSVRMPDRPEILVVDDMLFNLKLLSDILSSNHFNVRVATDGELALETVEFEPPCLILLDVMMPEMNGFEVCKRLKANPKTQDIPVIFITALSETVNKVKGFQLGAVDYITKPFEREEVLARVKTHLHLSHLQRQAALFVKESSGNDGVVVK
jgi:class 3 adenylate cyclase/CheY-like chemotaxis protein/PAS domain-containing protein